MLTRVAVIAVIVVAAAPAYAQQDPELERDGATQVDQDDDIDDPDAAELDALEPPTSTATGTSTVTAAGTPTAASVLAVPASQTRWRPRVDARVRAGAGAVSGDTINPGTGAISILDGELIAGVKRRRLELAVPLAYSHRQTFGTSLTEMHGSGGVRIGYRWSRQLRVAAEVGLAAVWKPNWIDPFQPMDTGELGTTNRYSHWDRRAAAEATVRIAPWQRVHVTYEYVLAVYRHDPNFDAIYDPLHLAPWDREVHRADGEWWWRQGPLRLRVGAQVAHWKYFFMFAGDAHTGVTHAGPGGEPPNPLLELTGLKPRVAADYDVTNTVRVGARYELELMQDPFQGYLSYVGHHPELVVRWLGPRDLRLTARAELLVRRYGSNSYLYVMDPDHPPLAWGDRRAERVGYASAAATKPLTQHWSAIAEAKLAVRRTNYAYSIDWNYVNYLAWTGAEFRY